jgi:hypothetical protein
VSTFICRDQTGSSQFETTINRFGWRSLQLSRVVTDIELYLKFEDGAGNELVRDDSGRLVTAQEQINRIQKDFDAWRIGNPKEFAARFAQHASDFLEELKTKKAEKLDFDLKEGDLDDAHFHEPPITADNPYRGQGLSIEKESHLKKVRDFAVEKTPSAFEIGVLSYDVAKDGWRGLLPGTVKQAETLAHVGQAGKVGLGLTGAGIAVQVPDSLFAVRSCYRTAKHLIGLQELQQDDMAPYVDICVRATRGDGGIRYAGPTDNDKLVHRLIKDHILPYIIYQKWKKLAKKGATVITLGLEIDLFSAVKAGLKWTMSKRGVKRYKAAHWLAYHFCTCECNLAGSIVRALTSDEEARRLLNECDYEGIACCLAEKMKSI